MTLLQSLFKAKKEPEPIVLKGWKVMPSVRCTDPAFKYTPAVHTDLAATFARARRDMGVTV
jgi:hypothetical protein